MIKKLSEAVGVSGNEIDVRNIIKEYIEKIGITTITDSIGNLIATTQFIENRPTVILSAHMDEPGIIVTDVTQEGYLKFDIIGDIDVASLVSQHIRLGETEGIISLKAVHLTTKEERQKKVKASDLFIDIGALNKEDAKLVVSPGDYGAFSTRFKSMSNHIKGKSLASRAGCSIILDILTNIKKYDINIVAVFSVQREISGRGINVAAYALPDADYMILLDAEDATPDSSLNDINKQGISLCRYNSASGKTKELLSAIEKIASESEIVYHRNIIDKTSEIQQLISRKNNLPIIPINIPCEFIGTGVNLMNKRDIESAISLIDIILRRTENGKIYRTF